MVQTRNSKSYKLVTRSNTYDRSLVRRTRRYNKAKPLPESEKGNKPENVIEEIQCNIDVNDGVNTIEEIQCNIDVNDGVNTFEDIQCNVDFNGGVNTFEEIHCNVDFNHSHNAWMENKIRLGNGMYAYKCGKPLRHGRKCSNKQICKLGLYSGCKIHYKWEENSTRAFIKK